MIKNHKSVIDLETQTHWKIERRTRGAEVDTGNGKPMQTWVLVLTNRQGHRKFVHEHRIWEQFKPLDA